MVARYDLPDATSATGGQDMIERDTIRELLAGLIIAWVAYLFGRANGTRVVYVVTTIEPLPVPPEVAEPARESEPVPASDSLADARD
jgi:hypothetical protein